MREVSSDEMTAAAALGILDRAVDPIGHWWLHKRVLGDGRVLYLQAMLGNNLRISLSRHEHDMYFHSNYCFHDVKEAWRSALGWDGEGDPEGWVRHIETGRRRPDGDAEREFIRP
jgi:hypothetical protein